MEQKDKLKLTAQQERLVRRFDKVVKELEQAHVGIVTDSMTSQVWFYNHKKVAHTYFPEDSGDGLVNVRLADLWETYFGGLDMGGDGDSVNFEFKD